MPKRTKSANGQVSKVDSLLYGYSLLTDDERRQFDRKHNEFRRLRRAFSGVFERMRGERVKAPAPPAESQK